MRARHFFFLPFLVAIHTFQGNGKRAHIQSYKYAPAESIQLPRAPDNAFSASVAAVEPIAAHEHRLLFHVVFLNSKKLLIHDLR